MSGPRQSRNSLAVARLMAVDQQIKQLQRERTALVQIARAENQSWQQIAAALGMSRQAAWEAHRVAEDTVLRIRARSRLTEDEALSAAKAALDEHRAGQAG
jgi:pyrroloquinoline quinone (PQQ) biosynthesis protein C